MHPNVLCRVRSVTLSAALLTSGLGCSVVTARGGASGVARPGEWNPLPCRTCGAARVAIDVRRTTNASGGGGRYAFARIRNLKPYGVVVAVEFSFDVTPSGDEASPWQVSTLSLKGVGQPGAEAILRLQRVEIAEARVSRAERF